MTTAAERRAAAVLVRATAHGVFALLAISACKRAPEPEPNAGIVEACASACAALGGAHCFDETEPVRAQRLCVDGCAQSARQSRVARCSAELLSYLSCLGRSAGLSCPARALSTNAWLEHMSELSACSPEGRAHAACTRSCREAGIVHTASQPGSADAGGESIQAEVIGLGCTDDEQPRTKKSAAGAPCTHHSVCTPARCQCPERGGAYLARACVAGRCADAASACTLAPRAVGHDVCGPSDAGGGG